MKLNWGELTHSILHVTEYLLKLRDLSSLVLSNTGCHSFGFNSWVHINWEFSRKSCSPYLPWPLLDPWVLILILQVPFYFLACLNKWTGHYSFRPPRSQASTQACSQCFTAFCCERMCVRECGPTDGECFHVKDAMHCYYSLRRGNRCSWFYETWV